jgi:preprotein translocase subunit SecA
MIDRLPIPSWLARRALERVVAEVAALEPEVAACTDEELRRRAASLRHRARCGASTDELRAETFALMRAASQRTLGVRHYDVQILAAAALCSRSVVEMQTGEGKTITAALPLALFGLRARGAYLATSNDYLARRDAENLGPAFRLLGLSVGSVVAGDSPEARRRAYRFDITYGTGKEFGFDFLRDRLRAAEGEAGEPLQREPFFILADEADNLLIDEAVTPLLIARAARSVAPVTAARFRSAAAFAERFREPEHYSFEAVRRRTELTAAGRTLARGLPYPSILASVPWSALYEDIERAITAERGYRRDKHYVIRNGEVVIVDEFTGRASEGRKWRDGLHQAVEAKESLEITDDGGMAAHICVQDYFRRFPNLAGMSGTVADSAAEFRTVYRTRIFVVPTHRPCRRERYPPKIYRTLKAKLSGIVEEIRSIQAAGRPVLIGTRTIGASLELSRRLEADGVEHLVLNAQNAAQEAEIIAHAGEAGRVTIATNMAGRGTDILLGPGVAAAGGLHVVLSEMHDAARIDRQFIGRAARQGDPGSFRLFLSLDDELLTEGFGVRRVEAWRRRESDDTLPVSWLPRFETARSRSERRRFQNRKRLLIIERRNSEMARDLGFDPCVDLPG